MANIFLSWFMLQNKPPFFSPDNWDGCGYEEFVPWMSEALSSRNILRMFISLLVAQTQNPDLLSQLNLAKLELSSQDASRNFEAIQIALRANHRNKKLRALAMFALSSTRLCRWTSASYDGLGGLVSPSFRKQTERASARLSHAATRGTLEAAFPFAVAEIPLSLKKDIAKCARGDAMIAICKYARNDPNSFATLVDCYVNFNDPVAGHMAHLWGDLYKDPVYREFADYLGPSLVAEIEGKHAAKAKVLKDLAMKYTDCPLDGPGAWLNDLKREMEALYLHPPEDLDPLQAASYRIVVHLFSEMFADGEFNALFDHLFLYWRMYDLRNKGLFRAVDSVVPEYIALHVEGEDGHVRDASHAINKLLAKSETDGRLTHAALAAAQAIVHLHHKFTQGLAHEVHTQREKTWSSRREHELETGNGYKFALHFLAMTSGASSASKSGSSPSYN